MQVTGENQVNFDSICYRDKIEDTPMGVSSKTDSVVYFGNGYTLLQPTEHNRSHIDGDLDMGPVPTGIRILISIVSINKLFLQYRISIHQSQSRVTGIGSGSGLFHKYHHVSTVHESLNSS